MHWNWKHPVPPTVDDIEVTRQASLQAEWATAERLEEIAQQLNDLWILLDRHLNPPA